MFLKLEKLKILAIEDKLSGGNYHRLKLPLSFIEGVCFVEEITPEIIHNLNPDVLWIHNKCKIKAVTIALWKSIYGFKLIFDMDDSWVIPKEHPRYEKIKNRDNSKDLSLLADYVIVSTNELVKEVLPYNENIVVIPNRIPYGEHQFQLKEEDWEEFEKRKIRVGLIGSYSHQPDYKMIKGWLNTLVTNSLFKQECEFVICGYHKSVHSLWSEFLHLGKVASSLPVDHYMKLYQEVDIILCPLRDNQLNRAKSSIKILESACNNNLLILDPLYKDKNDIPADYDHNHFFVNKDKDWLNIPLGLIKDKKNLWQLKNQASKKVRNLDYKEVIRDRINVVKKCFDSPIDNSSKNRIYSITYKDEIPVEYIEYFNRVTTVEEKSYLFEYNVILDIVSTIEDYEGWLGIFSWKFPLKTHLFKKKVEKILDELNYDCINFCKPLSKPYLLFTEKVHPGFLQIFKPLCQDLNLIYKEPVNVIYSNQFVLKALLYKEYVETIIKPTIYLLETKYKDLAWRDANYTSGLKGEELKKQTGLDHYTFHTFILERLISLWIEKRKIKCLNYFK